MSSNEEDNDNGDGQLPDSKQLRTQRACDICRRKKRRCDGIHMPESRCSNCIASSSECTYVEAGKRRNRFKGYVKALEMKLEKMDRLIRRLCPDEATYEALMDTLDQDDDALAHDPINPSSLSSRSASSHPSGTRSPTLLDSLTTVIRGGSDLHRPDTDDDHTTDLFLSDTLKELFIEPNEYDFFGKSNWALLFKSAVDAKNQTAGASNSDPGMRNMRSEFWLLRDWEKQSYFMDPRVNFEFPEADLAGELIVNYFRHFNLYLPLLHRPTFEKELKQKLHLVNPSFAVVYLLVCALGGRYSDDPRVLLPRDPRPDSAGWRYFEQVINVKKAIMGPPTLYDLQYYPLAVQFMSGSSMPKSCWVIVGVGLRVAQDAGIHKQKRLRSLTAQDQLWKRAFWILVALDRQFSAFLGRPHGIHDEDFDADLPVDCDDEYWEAGHPTKDFKQPEGQPSKISAFILYLKLIRVLSITSRTVYATNKCKGLVGFSGPQWEQTIVAELDSALNVWVDSLPPHLRWDPSRADEEFFNQSVFLYSIYYIVQIFIHRPFVPTATKPSSLSFPSLAICTNAARSCSHLIDLRRRQSDIPFLTHTAVCSAGVVLLLSLWSGKRSGLTAEIVNRDMKDVHACMRVLKVAEKRWKDAGRLWDILYELACAGELPLPGLSPQPPNKRTIGSDVPNTVDGSVDVVQGSEESGPRIIAGTRRTYKDHSQPTPGRLREHLMPSNPQDASLSGSSSNRAAHTQWQPPDRPFVDPPADTLQLPLYTNDLGRLPLHEPFVFTPTNQQHHAAATSYSHWTSPVARGTGSIMDGQNVSLPAFSDVVSGQTHPRTTTTAPSLDLPAIPDSSGPSFQYYDGAQSLHGMDAFSQMPMAALGDLAQHQQAQVPQQPIPASNGLQGHDFEIMDDEVMAMWMNAPAGLLMDWGGYLSNLTEMSHSHQGQGQSGHDPQSF